jgi:hypothetical protein
LTPKREIAILIRFREYPEHADGNEGVVGGEKPGKFHGFPSRIKDGRSRFALYWILEKENRRAT